jgi:hypothetical protein
VRAGVTRRLTKQDISKTKDEDGAQREKERIREGTKKAVKASIIRHAE